ncbi:hemolysin type calcium-binding protein [Litoreibacter ponti]|uniref:Hemolysin type calcium-binding protein n=1 Tax=Litoreibacter ponti TaxID=1510457 RepID=A0A2T6BIA3_9RHOB|nr:calcium-binding protein [Litoreibacter ponti]PTX55784.1 hemolysin type calcium-binding protein [Litoreibacter ponti]
MVTVFILVAILSTAATAFVDIEELAARAAEEPEEAEGEEIIRGSSGPDILSGTDEDDVIVAGSGDDTVRAGAGDDAIYGGAGDDTLNGEDGNDVLIAGPGEDQMTGGEGADLFVIDLANPGNEITDYEDGDQIIVHSPDPVDTSTVSFAAQDDGSLDILIDGEQHSSVSGAGVGDAQSLPLLFRNLNDTGDDPEAILAGLDQTLTAREGTDGNDMLNGTDAPDTIMLKDGDDTSFSGAGDDVVDGGAGDDWIDGGDGADVLIGAAGDDTLNSGAGRGDLLQGGAGADTLIADAGARDAELEGGAGVDLFVVSSAANDVTISDYEPGELIHIRLAPDEAPEDTRIELRADGLPGTPAGQILVTGPDGDSFTIKLRGPGAANITLDEIIVLQSAIGSTDTAAT